jgi:hypothetical protein
MDILRDIRRAFLTKTPLIVASRSPLAEATLRKNFLLAIKDELPSVRVRRTHYTISAAGLVGSPRRPERGTGELGRALDWRP